MGLRVARGADTLHGGSEPVPLATDLRSGTALAGYRLEEIVGRGGMGVVYRARHLILDRIVALKLLAPDAAADEAFRERFVRESRMAAALEHPHVVPVYDAGEQDGLLYIAMRYVDGEDLGTLLEREHALDPGQALSVAAEIGAALDAAHQRAIIHRDVKPANILLDDRGSYLSDFGLTKRVSSETRLTAHGQFVGTIDYMPPEQIEGARLDPASDIYAFGCVLYHMLAGAPPFQRESAVSLMYAQLRDAPPAISHRGAGLPEALDAVFARALAKQRADRFESCSELVDAARAALGFAAAASPLRLVPRTASAAILVAARDPRLRAAVRGMLDAETLVFAEAGSSQELLAVARESRPDVVVLDWLLDAMPADCCRRLKAEAGPAGVKILVLAARFAAPDVQAREEAGVDGMVLWPSSALQLQLKVAELLADARGDVA